MKKVRLRRTRGTRGMTLPEVVISLAIGGLVFGGVLTSYLQALIRAEWSAYNLAGHSLAIQCLEQARAAKWDTQSSPPVDLVVASNFPVTVDVLDIPISGTNITFATNFVTISQVSFDPPLKLISVDTVWAFRPGRVFTNTTVSYRAPDQ
jgi:prepilin-type N-terminal cleavage/methylation domain-containing protein